MPRDQENTTGSKSILWQIKLHLQFTGWLQYVPSVVITLILSLCTTIISVIGYRHTILFYVFAALTFIFLLNLIMEIITVKFAIRLPESKPSTNPQINLSMLRVMRQRRSCRSFQTQKLSQYDLHKLMQHVKQQMLPSARLGDGSIRFEYLCAPVDVWPVVNAKEYLVAIAPAEYNRSAVVDVGRCLQKIILHATTMNIATCWIGPGASHDSVIKELGPSKFKEDIDQIICLCAVGYKSIYEPLITRVMRWCVGRLPLTQLFFHNNSTASVEGLEEDMFSLEPIARFTPCFEACRWSPSSFNAQPTRCVVVMEKNDVKRLDFYASTSSRYYAAVALGIWLANFEMACVEVGIRGHFKELEMEEMKYESMKENDVSSILIKYDMSWIVEE
eukprot:73599_1